MLAGLVAAVVLTTVTVSAGGASHASQAPNGCRTLVAGDQRLVLDVDGRTREILVHVPPGAPTTAAGWPLVIGFHGFTGNADRLARTSMLGSIADEDGFVVAYPQGVGLLPAWHFPGGPARASDGVDDLHLMAAVLRHAATRGASTVSAWC
jgi:polyhydroxybutyrate depolymerase